MSCLAVNDNILVVAKGLHVDCYDFLNHNYFEVPVTLSEDQISDVNISPDKKYLALITSTSKQLIICRLPLLEKCANFTVPRSTSKLRFTSNSTQILVADKAGDVLIYDIEKENSGTKILGHLSLLLDVLQTNDEKFIISSDRDEKIRVSSYPKTYNIHTYCLGHKEFVNHIEILPHNYQFLTSTSGDGTIKIWNYSNGTLCYNINAYLDVDDAKLSENFTKIMDKEGVEVSTLPIVHYTVTKLNENASLLAVAFYSYNELIFYILQSHDNKFSHKTLKKLTMHQFPNAIKLNHSSLFLYYDLDCSVTKILINSTSDNISLQTDDTIKFFENKHIVSGPKENNEPIKLLYKRKFDNVQEYRERKKKRIENASKINISF